MSDAQPTAEQLLAPSPLLSLDEGDFAIYVANWRQCAIVKSGDKETARLDRAELVKLRDWLNEVIP